MRASGRAAVLLVAAAGLLPFGWLVAAAALGELGPEPVETLTHVTGEWALRLLVATLAVSPLRRLLGWSWLMPHRRTLGLLSFFYASLHFATYLVFDLELDFGELATDVRDRPYITVGFTSLMLLLPLAITSTRGWIKRLGRRWLSMHRLVYLAAIGAVVHFLWLVKADILEPAVYGAIIACLLGFRLYWMVGRKRRTYATLPRSPQGEAP